MSKEVIQLEIPSDFVLETLKEVLTQTLPRLDDADMKTHAIECARAISRGYLEACIQATPSTRAAE